MIIEQTWEDIIMNINIVLSGPRGKMGTEAIKMIENTEHFTLVACIDRTNNGKKLMEVAPETSLAVPIYDDAETCFKEMKPDVFVDLTVPEVGFKLARTALLHHIHTVVGTSGFSNEQINELSQIAERHNCGCLIAPNFALGAVLMMHFAKIAAKYFPDVEIIEKHHDNKIDAPSGTAVKTIDLIREVRDQKIQGHPDEYEIIEGARGGEVDGIRVHSLRLPGLVAHQEVVFGSKSQLLTIKHDSFHRESFMDGLKLSIRSEEHTSELVYGLEHVLDLS